MKTLNNKYHAICEAVRFLAANAFLLKVIEIAVTRTDFVEKVTNAFFSADNPLY